MSLTAENEVNTEYLSNLITHLPVEILCKIFSHLTFYDRKNSSLCCKRWRLVFFETNFLKYISIKANNNLFTSRPISSQKTLCDKAPKHRASSSMALSSYSNSSLSRLHLYFYNNAINLEFENDSADVTMFLKNLGNNHHSIFEIVRIFFNFERFQIRVGRPVRTGSNKFRSVSIDILDFYMG